MDTLTAEQAQALAAIFAKVKCANVLSLEVSRVWPDHRWDDLIANERQKEGLPA